MGKVIIDGIEVSGSSGSATSIAYNNTNSGLDSTNVQGAIDELNSNIGKDENGMTVNEKLDNILESLIKKEFSLLEVQTSTGANLTYTFTDDSYYLFAGCGRYNSNSHSTIKITTECESIQLGASNSFLGLYLVKGQVAKSANIYADGTGGVASWSFKAFKVFGV